MGDARKQESYERNVDLGSITGFGAGAARRYAAV
jgi:hypothetical protein